MTIDSVAAITRAVADLGRTFTPGGLCLGHNATWQLNGVQSTFGAQGKHAQYAIDGWNWSAHKVTNGSTPYHGAPVYFGPSPTRRDANAPKGDVCIYHAGVDKVVATDAHGNVVGLMTIAQRAAQTQRPYLGHTLDFLGTMTTGGAAKLPTPPAPAPAPASAPSHITTLVLIGGIMFPFTVGSAFYMYDPQTGIFHPSNNDITTLAAVKFGTPRTGLSAPQMEQIKQSGFGIPFLLQSDDGKNQQYVLYRPKTGRVDACSRDVAILYNVKFGLGLRAIKQSQVAAYKGATVIA